MEGQTLKTAPIAIGLNLGLLASAVAVRHLVLTPDVSRELVGSLIDTAFVMYFPFFYMGAPLVAVAICISCLLSHFRYERARWKLLLALSTPSLILAPLIALVNPFLSCCLVT